MKKLYKILAVTFAFALIVASPATIITSHAQGLNADSPTYVDDSEPMHSDSGSSYGDGLGFNPDSPEHSDGDGRRPDNAWENSSSSDSGSSSNESSAPAPAPSVNSSSSNSGSNESNEPAPAPSYNSSSSNNGSSSSVSTSNHSTAKSVNDITVNVTGGQKFRIVMSTDHTTYQVYHCGDSKATFAVSDADGNAVAYSTVKLEKGEDKLWYINTTFAKDVDTKDFTVTVTKGDATYLSTTLGVSGIKLNGTVALSTVPVKEAK